MSGSPSWAGEVSKGIRASALSPPLPACWPVGWLSLGTRPGQTDQDSHGLQQAKGLGGPGEGIVLRRLVCSFQLRKKPASSLGRLVVPRQSLTPRTKLQGLGMGTPLLLGAATTAGGGVGRRMGSGEPLTGRGTRAGSGGLSPREWQGRNLGWHHLLNSRLSCYLSAFSHRIIVMSNPKNVFRSFLLRCLVLLVGRGGVQPSDLHPEDAVSPTLGQIFIRWDCRGHQTLCCLHYMGTEPC